jgi:hypothetical protein
MRSTTQGGPNIVLENLIFYLDAANPESLFQGSTNWRNLEKYPTYDITLFNDAKYVNTNKGAVRFDGTSDYGFRTFTSGDLYDINLTGEITLDVWIKWDNILRTLESGVAFGLPFGNNAAGHFQWQFSKLNNGAGKFRSFFAVSNLTNSYLINQIQDDGFFLPNTPIQNNKWFNFTYTYKFSNGNIIGYVNGENAGGVVLNTNPSSLQIPTASFRRLNIGADSINSGQWSMLGDIAIVKIYNRVLTSDEVLQNFNAHKLRFGY